MFAHHAQHLLTCLITCKCVSASYLRTWSSRHLERCWSSF